MLEQRFFELCEQEGILPSVAEPEISNQDNVEEPKKRKQSKCKAKRTPAKRNRSRKKPPEIADVNECPEEVVEPMPIDEGIIESQVCAS